MPIVRILLVLLALATPAFAQDGTREAAAAKEAAQTFRVYVQGVTKKGARPDLTRPEIAALLGRIFDDGALTALPPAQASDMDWLLDWMEAAKETSKLIMFYGAKPGTQPDYMAVQRNMTEYEDQYATATNFMIRFQARMAVAGDIFMANLAPEQRTAIRQKGRDGARHAAAEMIVSAIGAVILSAGKPENARLVAAAISDTREVWASYFLPQDRTQMIAILASLPKRVADDKARADLAAFSATLLGRDSL
jgi:hypothetical protein